MALSSGTQLGPYAITAPLGAGGMGEVYKATDTRLNRTVAIKVLPEHVASNADLKRRFEREAKTISSLNHPHICTLYDVGTQDGIDFLVMEYLEGETLEQRLKKGALPLDQTLQIAIQVADALATAHRAAVIHRDLKPGNIVLTKSGRGRESVSQAKLLDFGLAKAAAPAVAGTLSILPTTPPGLTQQGTILGTLHYMAPEQVEGKDADARSDIFALGAVIYELATGKKAFDGKSTASVLAAILEREPPAISASQPLAPAALDRVVKKCLAKEPERRWQSASDLADELSWTAEAKLPGASDSTVPATRSDVSRMRWVAVAFSVLLTGGAIAGLAVWNLRPVPPLPVSRMVIALPPGDQLAGLGRSPVAVSVDGRHVAYVAARGGRQQIYVRALESAELKPLSGTEGATDPFFSPNGQWVGFFADGKLKKVSLSDGTPIVLSDAASPRGASWGDQGTIVFNPAGTGPLLQIPETGGSSQPLTHLERGDSAHRWPQLLPGGRALLFAGGTTSAPRIVAYSLETGEQRNLIPGATYPRYVPSGHLVYVQGASLMAVPFDARQLEVAGAAVPVVANIRRSGSVGAAHFAISAGGSLAYVPGGAQADQRRLLWVGRNGTEQPLSAPPRAYELPSPRFSRDGGQLAVSTDGQIWLYSLSRGTFTRFTFEGESNTFPLWTPDGKRIAFTATTLTSLFWQLADGSGERERLTTSENPQYPLSFSPDGQLLALVEVDPATSYDIWVLDVAGRKALPFLRTPFIESVPRFSPDGRWLAYVSNESGAYEVYVQPYPGPGGKWQISPGGGTEPAWNPNGRELFYRSADKMMAVDFTTQPTFSVGKPRVLFDKHYLWTSGTIPMYDVAPDGQRFLMVEDTEGATPVTQINMVLNWTEELKRLVPAK